MNKKYKNILFDLDGTITDPFLGITSCINHALQKLGMPTRQDLGWCIGPPLQDSFEQLLKEHHHLNPADAVAHYRERFATIGMFENEVYEGIEEMLQKLTHKGYRLFIATSKPHVFSIQIIEHFALKPYFQKVYGSELDGTRANKAELIQYILDSEKIVSSETIMIGDRKYDLIGAKKNDMSSIGITWGYGGLDEQNHEKPEAIFHHPKELTDYLVENFAYP